MKIGTVLLALALASSAAFADKKKESKPELKERVTFDIRTIVWPNPPAVARIKFQDMYTGQPIDYSKYETTGKKKTWMDVLAGTRQTTDIDASKLPYQLLRPYGAAVDSKGNIYVADQGVGAIFVYNTETKATELIRNGHEASFNRINGLAIDDDDRIFVADGQMHKVTVLSPKHRTETAFGATALSNPAGIALDRENRFLYVVDTPNDVVDVFSADAPYKLLRKIGTPGKKHELSNEGNFALPTNVAVDSDGNVYVTDTLNARVQIFDADGQFISAFGDYGDGADQLERPKGIAVDRDGHIWVVDEAQDRVKVFNREGKLLIYFGTHGTWPGQFCAAYGITIDKDNRVITTEQFPGRVQVFRYVTDAEAEKERQANKE